MLPFPSLPWFELARFGRRRFTRAAIVAVVIIPLFYGVLYTWSNWNPTGNLDRVQAAVVNQDKPVTVTGTDGKKQLVPLGRVLAGQLTGDTSSQDFSWVLTDASHAGTGLKQGTFGAVVTIPPNFSAAATSTSGTSDSTPQQATLGVRTNDAQNYLSGTLARAISTAATGALNAQVSQTYLSNLYVGFGTLHDQLGEASGGASDLADGAGTLADGAAKADQGAGALVVGLQQLASGTSALPSRTARLDSGAQQLSSGASKLAGGAGALSSGLGQLQFATSNLPAQSRQLADGAKRLDSGAGQLADGATSLAAGAANVATGTGYVSAAMTAYSTQLQALSASCGLSGASTGYCAQVARVAAGIAPLAKSTADLGTGATFVQGGARQLATGASQLGTGAHALSQGTRTLAASAPKLSGGIADAAGGARRLSSGATRLSGGARQLVTGTAQLAAAAPRLSSGIGQAAEGAGQLHDGTGQLATGAGRLSDGSSQLASGLRSGAAQVPDYTSAERASLAKVAATPVVSDVQRLNAVQSNGSGLAPYFAALALWVGAMAVYLLLRALPARALASTASSSRVALSGYLPGAVLVTAQALLLVGVLHFVVGIDAARLPALALFAVLAGLVFAAINQALIASFGGAGRFLALIFISLQLTSAGGTYPIETAPAFFRALHDVLPMTYAVQGMRACIAGGSGLGTPVLVLLAWLAIGLLVTIFAATRQRTWTVARLHHTAIV